MTMPRGFCNRLAYYLHRRDLTTCPVVQVVRR
jgi:hypothetical protein